jgi:ubiquitin-protein ligase
MYYHMATEISRETINRLLKDIKQIIKNPLTDNGIYYIHDDQDMMIGYALIIGPADTPYFGGNYFFQLNYPADYPHSPPSVKYFTNGDKIRFNPNLYKCGKVCVSLLNTWRGDQWTSCQTISSVLLTLCTLLCKDPLLNEPGITSKHVDMRAYTDIIEYANIKVAVCGIIDKNSDYYVKWFSRFETHIQNNFDKNYESIVEFVKQKLQTDYKKAKIVRICVYNMTVVIDYEFLLTKLSQYNNKLK